MKNQFAKFVEFSKTPFPYLFLALCIFLSTTLLGNEGFRNSMTSREIDPNPDNRYEICLVCSGPGAHDALSDIGFTVANFMLFPVTAAANGTTSAIRQIEPVNVTFVYFVYLSFTTVYGIFLPFLIFRVYEALVAGTAKNRTSLSVYGER